MLIPQMFLIDLIKIAWSKQSSSRPTKWTDKKPFIGQSIATSLVVQEFLGGTILRSRITGIEHYWNKLPNGNMIDITDQEFTDEEYLTTTNPETMHRDILLDYPLARRRYQALLAPIYNLLQEINIPPHASL